MLYGAIFLFVAGLFMAGTSAPALYIAMRRGHITVRDKGEDRKVYYAKSPWSFVFNAIATAALVVIGLVGVGFAVLLYFEK